MEFDTIWQGDSYPISVAWAIPDATNPLIDLAAAPSAAVVRVVRLRDGEVLVDDEDAAIEGDETNYLVAAEHTALTGEYAAYITATFADGTIRTTRLDYLVQRK